MPNTHYHDKTDNTDKVKAIPKINLSRYTRDEFITKRNDCPNQQNISDNPFEVHLNSVYLCKKNQLDNFRTKEQLECRKDERTIKNSSTFYFPAKKRITFSPAQ